ncbi:NHL repeat-containing protein [Luteimonas sp. SX5]|uniref:NHL repeat-containing protein n=1 Tax=Luteimonas galliterrae TaxID=2940486 RepID=A0ABT0MNU5_9GAMM|nr:NHL repeat-containing protein [Luteimonas galliterrae]MCL1635944.1 NHL repeat-containing protein [Luteimonas galliterrae]
MAGQALVRLALRVPANPGISFPEANTMKKARRSDLRLMAALTLALALPIAAQAQEYVFQTIAGDYDGDGGRATKANLGGPTGVAFDTAGNMYVAEAFRHRIRKITADGKIRTVAGTGAPGYSEQSGTGELGRIHLPQNMIADGLGNLYFADSNNNRVRKLWADGRVTLVAGNGSVASSGDGGRAVDAGVGRPYGLTLDTAGNLYVSENINHRVRRVTPQGKISTVAGNGTGAYSGDGGPATLASLRSPMGVAVDPHGNLFIADHANQRIRKVDVAGRIGTFVKFDDSPSDVSFGPSGDLYVSRFCGIAKLTPNGAMQPFVEDPQCQSLSFPEKVAFSSTGDAYFADSDVGTVFRMGGQDVSPVKVAGRGSFYGDGAAAVDASLSKVTGVATDAAGEVYIADSYFNNRIRKILQDGTIATVAGSGYWFDGGDEEGIPAVQAKLSSPHDSAVDSSGNLYIADRLNGLVRMVSAADGSIHTFAGGGAGGDGGPATNAKLGAIRRVAIDGTGNVFIADASNHRIRRVDTAGIITTVAGNGIPGFSGDGGAAANASLNLPSGIAIDASGNLYIGDEGNRRVRKVTPGGTISTVAGNGLAGSSGDGGPATQAAIGAVTGIGLDDSGALYIAAGALRKVTSSGVISTLSGVQYPAYDVAVGDDGALYVASLGGRVLRGFPAARPAARASR